MGHFDKKEQWLVFSTGTGLEYSTYIGGSGEDHGYAITLDSSRNIYITGISSSSTGFPLRNAFQPTHGGGDDAIVLKLKVKRYSTYIGGTNTDEGYAIEWLTRSQLEIMIKESNG